MRIAKLFLVFILMLCFYKSIHIKRPVLDDFRVYETAATLVRQHHSDLIYNGADTGEDPQVRYAEPNSAFAVAARSIGIPKVRMYVYPPLLADLLIPLTWMNSRQAGDLWTLLSILELCGVAAILMTWFRIRWNSWGAIALFVGVFSFPPEILCIFWGQVTILLLLLWTFGIFGYLRGWIWLSAGAFALAAAIKLTPLIVLPVFILWKEWKLVRSFAVSLLVLSGLTCLFNGTSTTIDYFSHVMPVMSAGVALFDNRSLLSAIQISYMALTSHLSVPHGLMVGSKLVDLILIVAAFLLSLPLRTKSLEARGTALALFAMLAVALSPVSWLHAFAVCFVGLCALWAKALRDRTSVFFVSLLTCCSVELSVSFWTHVVMKATHSEGFSIWMTPLLTIATVMYGLWLLGAKETSHASGQIATLNPA